MSLAHCSLYRRSPSLDRRMYNACKPQILCVSGRAGRFACAASEPKGVAVRVIEYIDNNFLPIGLLTAIGAGWAFPHAALRASEANASLWTTIFIFVLSGLQIKRGEAASALKSWRAYIFGLISILCFTPLLSKMILAVPLQPIEFSYGLAVFCCMPTSLSANIALTQTVGGNTAMSLLLTVSSNLIAIFSMPLMLSAALSSSGSVSFDPVVMIGKLVKTVLLPLCIGVTLRAIDQVREKVDSNKKLLRNLATLCLVTVPYTQIGLSKLSGDFSGLSATSAASLIVLTLLLLITVRLVNITAVHLLQLGQKSDNPAGLQRAVILASSQKTLPVAIAVLSQMTDVIGSAVGLASIPCVLAHLSQVLIDSFLVSFWKRRDSNLKVA